MFFWVYKTNIENFFYDYFSLPLGFLLEIFLFLSFSFYHISGTSHVLPGYAFFPQLAIAEEPSLSKISRQWHNPFSTPKDLDHLVFLDQVWCLLLVISGIRAVGGTEHLKICVSCDGACSKAMWTNRSVLSTTVSYVQLWVVFSSQNKLGHNMFTIFKGKNISNYILLVLCFWFCTYPVCHNFH